MEHNKPYPTGARAPNVAGALVATIAAAQAQILEKDAPIPFAVLSCYVSSKDETGLERFSRDQQAAPGDRRRSKHT
jgi:hypothetical protein